MAASTATVTIVVSKRDDTPYNRNLVSCRNGLIIRFPDGSAPGQDTAIPVPTIAGAKA